MPLIPASIVVLLATAWTSTFSWPSTPSTLLPEADEAFFRDRIATILELRCLHCHGGDRPKGDLSLETRDTAMVGGLGGPAIEVDDPEASLLLDVIRGDDPLMPPEGDPLTEDQTSAIRRWIISGAPWPAEIRLRDRRFENDWWSLQPITSPEVPVVEDHERPRDPIDTFVQARLEVEGLTPAAEADKRTFIRRVTYDLTGLPPTPLEIDAFLDDDAPDAHERLVDRLLNAPRYGERMARRWLDLAHYADTHGYDKDKVRPNAWPYRDYVIRSFNRDASYEQFIREQIAGDVLEPGDPEGIAATGFLTAGPWDFVGHVELREGTVDKKKTRLIDRDDMLATTMSTFVSTTVHCARCHDHKFDPIPQHDYYRLQAVFAGIERGDRIVEDPEIVDQRAELTRRRIEVQARRAKLQQRADALAGPALVPLDIHLNDLRTQLDGVPIPTVDRPSATNGYHSAIAQEPGGIKWVQIDLGQPLPIDHVVLVPARPVDFPDTPGFGFPIRFHVDVSNDENFSTFETLTDQTEDDVANPGVAAVRVTGSGLEGRFVRVTATRLWERTSDYVFALGELAVLSQGRNVARGASVSARDSIEAGRWSRKHLVDGADSRQHLVDLGDPEVQAVIDRQADLLVEIQAVHRQRSRTYRRIVSESFGEMLASVDAELAAIAELLNALPEPSKVYAALPREPRPIHLLARGDVNQPGSLVEPGALRCVSALEPVFDDGPDEGVRRAALAEWIADPANPLTWRSIANRLWLHHFGRGLVATPSDFGRNGASPTHPELLDNLALEVRDVGSLKRLQRRIVLSATYRQCSDHDARNAQRDAGNRWIWRQNRRRLEAEEVRDAALFVAGTLESTMGGPGFRLFRFQDDHSPIYDHDDPAWIDPPSGRRRTIYRFVVRSVRHPFLECLDGADPNANVAVRNETITALQALAMLNGSFMLARAEDLARRVAAHDGRPDPGTGPIEAAYRLALGRSPTADERDALTAYAKTHGLTLACRLILNLNEFLFLD